MEIKDFVVNFAAQFDETEESVFTPMTIFKELDEWSSLTSLGIIAMVDDEYSVILKSEDVRNSETIEDIFNIVKSRK